MGWNKIPRITRRVPGQFVCFSLQQVSESGSKPVMCRNGKDQRTGHEEKKGGTLPPRGTLTGPVENRAGLLMASGATV